VSLQGATMPNGQNFSDWLETPAGRDWLKNKGRKARGEDGENSGP
jgi:hypothetical protein